MKKHYSQHIVLRVIVRLLIPYIFMFGLYIQLHGEYSPGGGFQAGVICAAVFIVFSLLYGLEHAKELLSVATLRILSGLGVLIYGGVGVAAMLFHGQFLNYSMLAADRVEGQKLGILVIELGVGLTVFAVMLLIYYVFSQKVLER